jgi:hypothetical protein
MRSSWVLLAVFVTPLACSVLTSLDQLTPTLDAGVDASSPIDARTDTLQVTSDGGDAATKPYAFSDDFNRADNDGGLDNGWIAKNAAFAIVSNAASRVVNDGKDYQDNIQTRPSTESVGDVEVSVEVVVPTVAPCSPQIHARVDPTSVSVPNTLDSYVLYLDNEGTYTHWIVGRQHGGQANPDTLDTLVASSPVEAGVPLRLTLRVQGTTTVNLFASVEHKVNSAWVPLVSHASTDTTGLRIDKPGVVGLGAGKGTGYETTGEYFYDNFIAKSP